MRIKVEAHPLVEFYFYRARHKVFVHRDHYRTEEDAMTAASLARHIFTEKPTIIRDSGRFVQLSLCLEHASHIPRG